MIGEIVAGLIGAVRGFFGNSGVGSTVGNGVANGAAIVALIGAIAPAIYWLIGHKDEVAVTFTYGQLAVCCLVLLFILKIVHYTRAGSSADRV